MINFYEKPFNQLSATEIFDALQLRSRVFVVEQTCVYQDPDSWDKHSMHIFGYQNDHLIAYARIIPPKTQYTEAVIGRVVTAPESRNLNFGKQCFAFAVKKCLELYPETHIRIMAQSYLINFYQNFGFEVKSLEFLEDGIPHVYMLYSANKSR